MTKSARLAFSAVMITFWACQPDAPTPLYTPELEARLSGFRQLPLTIFQQHAMIRRIRDTTARTFPVYSETGDLLSLEDIKKQKINMWVDCFGDSLSDTVRAVVFRKATKTDLDKRMQIVQEIHDEQERQVENWLGKTAPAFAMTTLDGKQVDLEALRGKTVVLNFWFIRCHACVQEMPELNRLVEEFGNQDVVYLAATFDSARDTKAFLEKKRFDYQIVPDAQYLFDRFRIKPCPVSMVIDPMGRITFADLGYEAEQQASYQNLRHAIRQSLKKGLKP